MVQEFFQFLTKHIFLTSAFIVVAIFIMVYEFRTRFSGPKRISAQQTVLMMNKQKVLLYDVRPKELFDKGHIVSSRHTPLPQIEAGDDIKDDKAKSIIVICERGVSATTAANNMIKQGFKHVFVLDKGLTEWREAHLPLVKS